MSIFEGSFTGIWFGTAKRALLAGEGMLAEQGLLAAGSAGEGVLAEQGLLAAGSAGEGVQSLLAAGSVRGFTVELDSTMMTSSNLAADCEVIFKRLGCAFVFPAGERN